MRHPVDQRLQRLLAVLAYLAHRATPIEIDVLADRLRISRNQLQSDLALAEFMGLPPFESPETLPEIHMDADTVWAVVPDHFGRQRRLSREEAFAVVTCGRAALEVDAGLAALASALDKVETALELEHSVQLEIEDPPHLDAFRTAQRDRGRLATTYWSAWRDSLTERDLDPIHVFYAEGEWYATCFDHRSQEIRKFRIDRVQKCDPTGTTFEPYDHDPTAAPYEPPDGAIAVTVRFPASARWVTEYVDVEVTDENDDGFTGVLNVAGTLWLERLLLRTGAEVTAPEDWCGLGAMAARRVLAHYT